MQPMNCEKSDNNVRNGMISVLFATFLATTTAAFPSDFVGNTTLAEAPSYKVNPARFGGKANVEQSKNRATEYFLTSNGVVTATPTEKISDLVDKAVTFQGKHVKGDLSAILQPKSGVPTVDRQNLTSAVDRSASITVTKCGPSPVSVEEIKRLVILYARKHGVDAKFALAITKAESGYDRTRNSPAGARGPMQLMPATAERFGVKNVCNPEQNISGGIRYLAWLLDEFGNPLYAAAGYNAGEQRIYKYGGIPPFAETLNYVAKVVSYQLGVEPPSKSTKAIKTASVKNTKTSNIIKTRDEPVQETLQPAGIIGNAAKGKWTGGVLQF